MADLGNSGTKLCNNCGQEINNASFMMHDAYCQRNIIKCEKCKKPFNKNAKDEHFDEFHAPIECECGEKIEKMFLEDHKRETCKKRKAQCFYCDLTLEFGKMKEHMDFCGTRTEKCAKCDKFIMHKDKSRHEESNCSYPVSTQPTTSKQNRLVLNKPTRPVENTLLDSIRQNQARGLVKKETNNTRKKSNADENFNLLPCEFCSESFPTDELFQHQVNCDQNRTFTRASNREDNDYELNHQRRFFERPTNNDDEIEDDDDESSFNMGHLTDYMNQFKRYKDTATNLFDSDDDQGIDVSHSTNNNDHQNTIPCEFCNRPISLDLIEAHQISCQQDFGISSYNLPRSSSMPKPFSGELSSFYVPNENKPTRLNRPTPTASNMNSSEKSPVKTRSQLRTFKDVSNNTGSRSSGVTVKKFPIGGTSVSVVNETRRKEDQESNQKPKVEPRRSPIKPKTTNPNPKNGQKSNKKQ